MSRWICSDIFHEKYHCIFTETQVNICLMWVTWPLHHHLTRLTPTEARCKISINPGDPHVLILICNTVYYVIITLQDSHSWRWLLRLPSLLGSISIVLTINCTNWGYILFSLEIKPLLLLLNQIMFDICMDVFGICIQCTVHGNFWECKANQLMPNGNCMYVEVSASGYWSSVLSTPGRLSLRRNW